MPENIPNDASSACRHRPDSHVDGVCLACLATYILEPGGESIPGHQDPVPPGLPDLTERYELGDQIGEGGFARVFRARQVGIDREVAVKIYKAEDSTQRLHSRLVTELRALAPLKHPNIVTVHEVGIFEGKPAIVMELLEGLENIVEYSEKRRIGITGRLGLLIDVCSAVHHLHSREPRILHRDIKPENILVIERDDHAAAKLLDFGIAKVIDDSALGWAPEVWQTHAGTLHYMSPEQAEGSPNIGPASDVFSLGVLMQELLAIHSSRRSRPFDLRPVRERADAIHNSELAAIVSKACHRDPTQRYETARDVAEDINRYLSDRPVSARRSTRVYVATKFLRRHIVAATAAALLLLVLIAASIVSLRFGFKSAQAEEASRRTLDFLTEDLLAQADPDLRPNRSITLRQAVDLAANRIDQRSRFKSTPLVEARVRTILGATYRKLGDFPAATAQLQRAQNLLVTAVGANHPDTLRVMQELGQLLVDQGRIGEAEQLLADTSNRLDRRLGPNDPLSLQTARMLAEVRLHSRRNDEAAIAQLRTILEQQTRTIGANSEDTIATMSSLGRAYRMIDAPNLALPLLNAVVTQYRSTNGIQNPRALRVLREQAATLAELGSDAEAKRVLDETIAVSKQVVGGENPFTIKLTMDLADLLVRRGQPDAAAKLYARAIDVLTRALGAWEDNTLAAVQGLAIVHAGRGAWDDVDRDFAPAKNMDQPSSFERAADVFARFGRLEDAEANLAEVIHLDQGSPLALYHYGSLCIAIGNTAGYARTYTAMQAAYGRSSDSSVLAEIAQLGTLQPVRGEAERKALTGIASRLDSAGPHFNAWIPFAIARVDFRTRNLRHSLSILETLRSDDPILETQALALQAMVVHELGQIDRAHGILEEAKTEYKHLPGVGVCDLGLRWYEILNANALLREAAHLITNTPNLGDGSAVARQVRTSPFGEIVTADHLSRAGRAFLTKGFPTQAEPLLRQSLEIRTRVAPGEWEVGYSKCLLGISLAMQNRWTDAGPLLHDGWAVLRSSDLLLDFPKLLIAGGASAALDGNGEKNERLFWEREKEEVPLRVAYISAERTRKLYRSWNQTESERTWVQRSITALKPLYDHYRRWHDTENAAACLREMRLLPSEQAADDYAHRGHWSEAARSYAEAISFNPEDLEVWYNASFIALQVDDKPAYKQRCRAMLAKYGRTTELETAERVAKACLVEDWSPNAAEIARIHDLVSLVESRITSSPQWLQPWLNLVSGIAQYRLHHYSDAIRYLQQSRWGDPFCAVHGSIFVALAQYRLGDYATARASLADASRNLKRLPDPETQAVSGWRDWVMCELAHKEAARTFSSVK